jgi:hypothetical protein
MLTFIPGFTGVNVVFNLLTIIGVTIDIFKFTLEFVNFDVLELFNLIDKLPE